MLGAVAEWCPSSVAGVSLDPRAVGGEILLFWPRIPRSATVVQFASATQGTKRGDASIAWQFLDLPADESAYESAVVEVHIRIVVPPSSSGTLRLPMYGGEAAISYAERMPNLDEAKTSAERECAKRRKAGMGFDYNWEYDSAKKEWSKFRNGKAIGTPCPSFLFGSSLNEARWSHAESISLGDVNGGRDVEVELATGVYDIVIDRWQLIKEIPDKALTNYCSDPDTFTWDVNDATHLI